MPCTDKDETNRYSAADANNSRILATSLRYIVENLHGAQKHFLLQKSEVRYGFFRARFWQYHPFINALLNCYGSTRASEGPPRETFTAEERERLLKENPSLIETSLCADMVTHGHVLFWKTRRKSIWREVEYDDPALRSLFPHSSEKFVMSLNGGPYLTRKAKGYIKALLDHYKATFRIDTIYHKILFRNFIKARKQLRRQNPNEYEEEGSMISNSPAKPYKIEVLLDDQRRRLYNDTFTAIIRSDILSFHSSGKKFKTYIAIQKTSENKAKYSTACTCNAGNRLTGCAHTTCMIYFWSHYLYQHRHL